MKIAKAHQWWRSPYQHYGSSRKICANFSW